MSDVERAAYRLRVFIERHTADNVFRVRHLADLDAILADRSQHLAVVTRLLALKLCELGDASDPRLPNITATEMLRAAVDGPSHFTAVARALTDDEARTIVAAYLNRVSR